MSQHESCRVNGEATNFVSRAELAQKRMFEACQPIRPGQGKEAQIDNACKELGLTYEEGWRAWRRRASKATADKIEQAWPAFEARQRERRHRELAQALMDMEQALNATGRDHIRDQAMGSMEAARLSPVGSSAGD